MDSDVSELLRTWELSELIPIFAEQRITVQALSALKQEDLKELIPFTGPRVLFTRCWETWKNEFTRSTLDNISFSNLDLSNIEFGQELPNNNCSTNDKNDPKDPDYIVISLEETEKGYTTPPSLKIDPKAVTVISPETQSIPGTQNGRGLLENILKKSLETSSLLIYKGGSLDGDATRNLLAAVIAKEILQENKNSPIVGHIYFKWVKLINELFPGERTTTYYIPSCTTASGVVLQARGKLVHQVLNKRRRLQQLGSLPTKKRSREASPSLSSSSVRPLPDSLNTSDLLDANFEEDVLWLKNASEPWIQVETKWKKTLKQRIVNLHDKEKGQTIEAYCNSYPALKKPCGYTLLLMDFDEIYADKNDKLFTHIPVAKLKILDLLKKRKSKDDFCQELISLADSSKEEDKNLAAFLSIPYLLNTTPEYGRQILSIWKKKLSS